MNFRIVTLPLTEIDVSAYSQAAISRLKIAGLAARFDPHLLGHLTVLRDGLVLVDGVHRFHALRRLGHTTAPVVLVVSREEADAVVVTRNVT